MQEDFERQIAIIKQNHTKVVRELNEEYTNKYREDLHKLEKGKEEKDELMKYTLFYIPFPSICLTKIQ